MKKRIEEYKQTGCYYIATPVYDVVWNDSVGEWRMSTSAKNMRSCMELDKEDRKLDEFGYEIVLGEFCLDTDKHKLEKVKYTNPLELERLKAF